MALKDDLIPNSVSSVVKFKAKDELPPKPSLPKKGMGGKRSPSSSIDLVPAWLRRFWETMQERAEQVNLAPPATPAMGGAYTQPQGGIWGNTQGWKPPAATLSYLQAANATPGAYSYSPYAPYTPPRSQALGIAGYPYLGTYREGYMGRVGGTWLPGANWSGGRWNTLPNAPYYPAPQAYGPQGQLKMFTWATPEVIQEQPPTSEISNLGGYYGGGRIGERVSYGGGRRGGGGGAEFVPTYRISNRETAYRGYLPPQPNIPRWLQAMVNWRIRG